ncbi:disulfide bond formation protein B, partial [Stenotrophomonas geniculata]
NIQWRSGGLTMPMGGAVWFVLLALWALVVSLRKVKR